MRRMSEEVKEKAEQEETAVETEETVESPETEKTEPADPAAEKLKELTKENEKLKADVAKLKNEYARAYADTENTRKRLQNEFEQLSKYHIQKFALEVLPVLDNCERALEHETSDEAYRKGVERIYAQLKGALEREGVTEIEALDKPFDGNWHQALMSEKVEGVEPGMVIQVLQKGYKLKDRILRAAMVKVSE